jgi:hypothetical protein
LLAAAIIVCEQGSIEKPEETSIGILRSDDSWKQKVSSLFSPFVFPTAMRRVLLCTALLLALLSLAAASTSSVAGRLRNKVMQTPNMSPFDRYAHMSMLDFHERGQLPGDDPFSQVRSVIGSDEEIATLQTADQSNDSAASFLEVGAQVGRVRSFCEICILVMQMKERGQPHLCAGLNTNYHITCIEVLESILRADKAIVYWLKNGCMHMDSEGPEIVRPCPAINICSWVPNLFADAPSLVRDGVESLCPKDPKFLPTVPQEFRNLLGATDNTAADTSAKDGPVDPTTKGL